MVFLIVHICKYMSVTRYTDLDLLFIYAHNFLTNGLRCQQ